MQTRPSLTGETFTQERLDEYYRQRAGFYNLTDYLYLGQFPRVTMREELMDMIPWEPNMRVLDYACGAGANFPYIMEKMGPTGHLVATDYSQEMLDSAKTQFVLGRGADGSRGEGRERGAPTLADGLAVAERLLSPTLSSVPNGGEGAGGPGADGTNILKNLSPLTPVSYLPPTASPTNH